MDKRSYKEMQIIKPRSVNSRMILHKKSSPLAVVKSTSGRRLVKRSERKRLKGLEFAGEVRLGSGKLPAGFWDMPKPHDPEGRARSILAEDRK